VSRPRKRAVGADAKRRLGFVDRLLATLVDLRHGTTHDVLACWFGAFSLPVMPCPPQLAGPGRPVASRTYTIFQIRSDGRRRGRRSPGMGGDVAVFSLTSGICAVTSHVLPPERRHVLRLTPACYIRVTRSPV
jgi:hypothetical protein